MEIAVKYRPFRLECISSALANVDPKGKARRLCYYNNSSFRDLSPYSGIEAPWFQEGLI
jgi:hypothetical protein